MIADLAVHDPDPPGHNPHAHVMLTMRPLDEHGRWLPKSKKEYQLDEAGNRIRDSNGKWKTRKVFTTDWDARGNVEKWRHAWETLQNQYLEKNGRAERIDMRSFKRQGTDMVPTVHMGPAVTAMEKRGIRTDIGDLNREIREHNRLLSGLIQKIRNLIRWIGDIKEALRQIDMEPKEIPLSPLLILQFNERAAGRFHWENQKGRQNAGIKDLKRFAGISNYLIEKEIYTISDLDRRMKEIHDTTKEIKGMQKELKKRLAQIDGIRASMDRLQELSPIHDQYQKIRWKKKQEAFYEEHRDELEEWKKTSRYLYKNLPDQKHDPGTLKKLDQEYSLLQKELQDLSDRLSPIRDETAMINDIRYLIREHLPELAPEREMPPEKKKQKQESIKELLARAKKESDRCNAGRKAQPGLSGRQEPGR